MSIPRRLFDKARSKAVGYAVRPVKQYTSEHLEDDRGDRGRLQAVSRCSAFCAGSGSNPPSPVSENTDCHMVA